MELKDTITYSGKDMTPSGVKEMPIKMEVTGYLGKNPYVQTINERQVTVLSLASRNSSGSRTATWITGTIWNQRLADYVQAQFKKGDLIQAFGVLSSLDVYYNGAGKAKPGLDMFINAIGFPHLDKET